MRTGSPAPWRKVDSPVVADIAERIGPYILDDIVGRGSSGVVWRGFDEISGEVVAVKMLDPTTSADPMARARFTRECELVGAFSHPSLVRLRAAGSTSDGFDYLVMDLALGETMLARISRNPPLTMAEGIQLVQQSALALGAMHDAGWIHRDVKPANVILGEDGRPRLLDYGLAARAECTPDLRLTRAGFFVGTPLYLAPEQLLGAPPQPTMDVYALGAMLYEVLVGEPPFVGSTETLLAAKATKTAPIYDGPAPVADLLEAALARRPEGRPVDAGAFAAALAEALAPPEVTADLTARNLPTARPMHDVETVTGAVSPGRIPPPRMPPTTTPPRSGAGPSAPRTPPPLPAPKAVHPGPWLDPILVGRAPASPPAAHPGRRGRPEIVAGVIFAAGLAMMLTSIAGGLL